MEERRDLFNAISDEEMIKKQKALEIEGEKKEDKPKNYNDLFQKGKLNFVKLYENFNQETIVRSLEGHEFIEDESIIEIKEKCLDKLRFGIKKYGDSSFQASLENCFASPFFEHAKDEVIDLINYLNHIIFVSVISGIDVGDVNTLKELIIRAEEIYGFVNAMEKTYAEEIGDFLQ